MKAGFMWISPRTKVFLRTLSKQTGKPIQAILDEAVERYQRENMDRVNAHSALREDPKAWEEKPAERALWETTVTDGWSLFP